MFSRLRAMSSLESRSGRGNLGGRDMLKHVSFDISRAVIETFGSRTPFLDRVLSYLYFADVAVIEQSTADEWGSGETIIGLKGDAESATGLVLAGSLPTLRTFPQSPSAVLDAGGHPQDLVRLVDLLARVQALSVMDPDASGVRLVLLAYRPDPVASSLRDFASSPISRRLDWLLSCPVGLEPRPIMSSVVLVEIQMSGGGFRTSGRRVRNVVSVCAKVSRYDPAFPLRALRDLYMLSDSGHVEVLDLEPCLGSDLLAPSRIEAVLGVLRDPLALPGSWRVLPETRPAVRLGTWAQVLGALLDLTDALSCEVLAAWTRVGHHPSNHPVRLVALRGTSDDCQALLAADIPTLDSRLVERLESVFAECRPTALKAHHIEVRVLPWEGKLFAMGPLVEQVWEDPAATARKAAEAYVKALASWIWER